MNEGLIYLIDFFRILPRARFREVLTHYSRVDPYLHSEVLNNVRRASVQKGSSITAPGSFSTGSTNISIQKINFIIPSTGTNQEILDRVNCYAPSISSYLDIAYDPRHMPVGKA